MPIRRGQYYSASSRRKIRTIRRQWRRLRRLRRLRKKKRKAFDEKRKYMGICTWNEDIHTPPLSGEVGVFLSRQEEWRREQENLPEEGEVGVSHPNFQTAQFPLFSSFFLFSLSLRSMDEIAIQANFQRTSKEPRNTTEKEKITTVSSILPLHVYLNASSLSFQSHDFNRKETWVVFKGANHRPTKI